MRALALALALAAGHVALPELDDPERLLPPRVAWDGASRALPVAPGDPWITPAEASGLTRTPDYATTTAWLRRLVAAAPQLVLTSIGTSAEGREIWLVVASADGLATPEAVRRSGRPVVLAHAGIHSGEIDGKDAGLMLLRDMTVRGTKRELLERAVFLFVPILGVDGHERISRHSRINQRGPVEAGWRTNRRNLNLNRDFAKLDTAELRALVAAVERWQPDLYLDMHVTDGADYRHDITYGYNGTHGWSPAIATWLDGRLRPAVDAALEAAGHLPAPLIFTVNGLDYADGIVEWTAGPRFSTGWGDARHLPTVLLENHSLKPYDQRVLGTYVWLEAILRLMPDAVGSLRDAVRRDRDARPPRLALGWRAPAGEPTATLPLAGIASERFLSPVTGSVVVRWTGEPRDVEVPLVRQTAPTVTVERPRAYLIPPAWSEIVGRLRLHGVRVEALDAPTVLDVERYRLPEARLAESRNPFEGRARVDAGTPVVERRRETLPAGTVRVPTDQPLGELAMLLLEPQSPDSFFQWGFFLAVLNRTEYVEPYVMEPLARRMLDADEALREAFEARLLADPAFAGDPRARLEWFYERTPFYDEEYRLYPVAREPGPRGSGSALAGEPGDRLR